MNINDVINIGAENKDSVIEISVPDKYNLGELSDEENIEQCD